MHDIGIALPECPQTAAVGMALVNAVRALGKPGCRQKLSATGNGGMNRSWSAATAVYRRNRQGRSSGVIAP